MLLQVSDADAAWDWAEANIDGKNIRDVSALNENMLVWVDQGSLTRSTASVRAWEHIEFYTQAASDAMNGIRSMYVLHEYRCSSRQSRQLAGTSYYGSDLTGRSVEFDQSRPSAWTYIQPNTIDNDMLEAACNGRRFFDSEEAAQ